MTTRIARMCLALALAAASCASPPPPTKPSTVPPARAPTRNDAPPAVDPAGEWELRWDRTFVRWWPAIFNGTLLLRRSGPSWTGSLTFQETRARFELQSLRVVGNHVEMTFRTETSSDPLEVFA